MLKPKQQTRQNISHNLCFEIIACFSSPFLACTVAMKINYGSQDQEVRIEILPLIDVIFCILTFFILASLSLTRQTAINMNLPESSTGVTQMRQTMVVTIDPIGELYIDKDPVSQPQLIEALKAFQEQNPEGVIALNAPPYASYNDVVRVLDLLRSVGGDRVALTVTPASSGADPLQAPQPQPNFNNPSNSTSPNNVPLDPFGLPTVPSAPVTPGAQSFPNSGGTTGSGAGSATNALPPSAGSNPAIAPISPVNPVVPGTQP